MVEIINSLNWMDPMLKKKNLFKRVKNTYSYGEITEIVRKSIFLIVFSITGTFTSVIVRNRQLEFGLNCSKRKDHIVVSLTSFPQRVPHLDMCLKSLVIQKVNLDKIIVYLENDSLLDMMTETMKKFQDYGVEYRFDKTMNLMPHKKYYPAMHEYHHSIIVIADDLRNVEFYVMGNGPLERQLKAESKDLSVIFTGGLLYPKMVEVLSQCDIAMNPIKKKATQSIINKHMDYAMAGLPVINTQENEEYRKLLAQYDAGISCVWQCEGLRKCNPYTNK